MLEPFWGRGLTGARRMPRTGSRGTEMARTTEAEKRKFLRLTGDKGSPMKRSDIPSLDDLRAFEAVARLGSVCLAADGLALTHGAVSRRITKLSGELGFRLFERSGRGLRLTPAGETLKLTTSRFLAELTATVESLRAVEVRQNALVLSCEPSVAMRWLIRAAGRFPGGLSRCRASPVGRRRAGGV